MQSELKQITLTATNLPDWYADYNQTSGITTIFDKSNNRPILAVTDPEILTLIMSIPRLLAFMASLTLRPNSPMFIDANQVLNLSNIKIEHKDQSHEHQ